MKKNNKTDPQSRTKNPCWKGYEAYGMKDKNGKSVPNCVRRKTKSASKNKKTK